MASGVSPAVGVASRAGEEFVQLYYESLDKRRHVMAPLYDSSCQVLWNGNVGHGASEALQLLNRLPTSEHQVSSFDCQPIPSSATSGLTSVLVSVEGQVRYEGSECKARGFTQQFILFQQDDVWKIASDCFRFVP